jgi:hypothetical protein
MQRSPFTVRRSASLAVFGRGSDFQEVVRRLIVERSNFAARHPPQPMETQESISLATLNLLELG